MTTNAVFPATESRSPLARRLPPFLMALLLAGVLLLAMSAAPGVRAGATEGVVALQSEGALVVNSTADTGDASPGDGVCDDGSRGRGTCTLRAAIEEANATAGTDIITFDIAGDVPHAIRPETPLPAITEAVTVDGTTEPDYAGSPVVVLDGALAGEDASGLVITAGDSTVRGLAVTRFGYAGILLQEGGNNLVASNHLGAPGQGNRIGVLADGSDGNTVGAGNLVAGNEVGVYLYGAGAGGNHVEGNAIAGNEAGVRITNAAGNQVGSMKAGSGNRIAGNETGIYIAGTGASGNRIVGNTIGLEADGRAVRANGDGITINGAPGNVIGGESDGAGNTIAGGGWGITIRGAQRNVVQGNRIGHDTTGAVAAEVVEGGVLLVDAAENTIGGTTAGAGNTITGWLAGVYIAGGDGNVVDGNTIDVLEDDEETPGAGVEILSTVTQVRGLPPSLHAGRILGKPLALWEESTAQQSGSTFTVDSTGDGGDANAGDGTCADGSGACTLRAAIEEANATAGADTIAFSIAGSGPHTIQPGSELPNITEAVTVDGTTEPDYAGSPVVELDGSNAGAGANGLRIRVANITVRGLAINRFDGDGIDIGANGDDALISTLSI